MLRLPRSVPSLLACFVLLGCRATPGSQDRSPGEAPDTRQIHWQRSLDDALQLAKAEGRPLLIAMNMDGESASDRIVHEEYRDPAFVAASRHYVCIVGSLFRHNPRDYDDQGRRIPCPRLGCCTCGEHIALEPILFERFLADGERVAPRHAAILPDGKKAWDLSLSFDLHDIDRELIATASTAPGEPAMPVAPDWATLAGDRSDRGRCAFEHRIGEVLDETTLDRVLDAIATNGDAGSLDALRRIAARLPGLSPALRDHFVAAVNARSLGEPMGTVLRETIQTVDALSGAVRLGSRAWLPVLAAIDGHGDVTRSFLLACRVADYPGAASAVTTAFGDAQAKAIDTALLTQGGPLAMADVMRRAAAVRIKAAGAAPSRGTITDEMPTAEALEQELEQLDGKLRVETNDAALRARFAKASLDLARRRIEAKGKDAALLLADAEQSFAKALAAEPNRAEWWIERARAAYFAGRFDDEVACGRAALHLATDEPLARLQVEETRLAAVTIEAIRWLGDGDVRRFAGQVAGDPAAAASSMLEGLRAFGYVASSDYGDDTDWTSFASLCGMMGLWREQLAVATAGAQRVPGGQAVRQCINQALWSGGRSDLATAIADTIARDLAADDAGRPDAKWYAGYAWILQAENERRTEQADAALASYAAARARFGDATALNANYQASCARFEALCHLGAGLANARVGRREAAADCLVAAVRTQDQLSGITDGLGYDVLDLVDKIGEWRAPGPSSVDPGQLLDRLDAIAPHDPFWAIAIADSQLREALRADGRNPVRAERDTVDAAGNPIRMPMGLPNDEGDGYLRTAIGLLRRAKDRLVSEEDKKALAQVDTIWAERMLERNRRDDVVATLTEASVLLAQPAPRDDAGVDELRRCAAGLRARLGEARPRWRMGR